MKLITLPSVASRIAILAGLLLAPIVRPARADTLPISTNAVDIRLAQRVEQFLASQNVDQFADQVVPTAKDWQAAVAVYRKLAAVGGTRSDEAKARLTQLRLEHFLWEE